MAGLPKVQLEKKIKMSADSGEVVPSKEPVVLSMVPTSKVATSEVSEPEVVQPPEQENEVVPDTDWKSEHETAMQRYRSLQGVIANLEPKARASEARIAQLEAELKQLSEVRQAAQVVADTSDDLTEEEQTVYGQSSSVIQKLARREAKQLARQLREELSAELKELKTSQQQIGRDLATTTEGQFLATVKANVKNFDSIISSPKWADYAITRIPYTQMTVADALGAAHNNRDLERILEIFNGFKPAASNLQGMASPAINGSAAPVSTHSQKATLRLSDRRRASDEFRKGHLSKDKLDLIVAEFAQADKEGRLDYNS